MIFKQSVWTPPTDRRGFLATIFVFKYWLLLALFVLYMDFYVSSLALSYDIGREIMMHPFFVLEYW